MNFFARQDQVRRQSRRLVLLFVLAVAAIVVAVNLAVVVGYGATAGGLLPLPMMGLATLGTLGVIGLGSAFRMAELRAGGAAVARKLGGTLVAPDARDPHYRRLRNVVEEIAIASGVPVPQVFVLEEETAINAFAAGYAPGDAAIAVTRGALDRLNRDELQGVIAHEFSHVLNGDMRLNIRLMGVLFGILVLAVIGRKVLVHGGRGSRNAKGTLPVLLAALVLMLVGYLGLLFGRLIKAGVSRQREFLADASAVQFTRQTRGLAGALKKVAGLPTGSKLASGDTEEVAHMLFGDGVGYSSLFATHPPLLARIQALEPSFKASALPDLQARWAMSPPNGLDEDVALGLHEGGGAGGKGPPPLPAAGSELGLSPPAVAAQVGAPRADDYQRASALVQAIPEMLREAARERDEALPLLLGLLLDAGGAVRERQVYELSARQDARIARQAVDYADRVNELPRLLHLPLAAMAMPALRKRPRAELERFIETCYALSHADGKLSLFEYCLGRLLQVQVADALAPARAGAPGRRRLLEAAPTATALMAVLAQAGHANPTDARRAYLAAMSRVFPRLEAPYSPPADLQRALDEAWPVLDQVEPLGKELLVEGLVAAVSHDGKVTVEEAELLRVVCATLHCPLPPMLEV